MYTVVVKQNEIEPAKDNNTSQIIRFTGKLIVAGKSQKLWKYSLHFGRVKVHLYLTTQYMDAEKSDCRFWDCQYLL